MTIAKLYVTIFFYSFSLIFHTYSINLISRLTLNKSEQLKLKNIGIKIEQTLKCKNHSNKSTKKHFFFCQEQNEKFTLKNTIEVTIILSNFLL